MTLSTATPDGRPSARIARIRREDRVVAERRTEMHGRVDVGQFRRPMDAILSGQHGQDADAVRLGESTPRTTTSAASVFSTACWP
jgi:hypothetical protein